MVDPLALSLIKQLPHALDVAAQAGVVERFKQREIHLVGNGRFLELGCDFAQRVPDARCFCDPTILQRGGGARRSNKPGPQPARATLGHREQASARGLFPRAIEPRGERATVWRDFQAGGSQSSCEMSKSAESCVKIPSSHSLRASL